MAADEQTTRDGDPQARWFWEHYDDAVEQTLTFLEGAGVATAGREMADVGCGDGILTLGLMHKGHPAQLTGFDIVETDRDALRDQAERHGVDSRLPPELAFKRSGPVTLPAADDSFDIVTTWSAFEHVADPAAVLGEISRVLRAEGVLFLQLWPFYYSERGSHLWDWFSDAFHHLRSSQEDLVREMEASGKSDPEWTRYMAREFQGLNRLTLDELQLCLHAAGLEVVRLELLSHLVNIPRGLRRYRLADLGVAGVKLLAVPVG